MMAGRIGVARSIWDIPNRIDQRTFPILQLMNHFSCYNYHKSITFIRRTWSTTCARKSWEDGSRVSREQWRFSEDTRGLANNVRALNPNLMTSIADGPRAKEPPKGKEMADTKISTGDVSQRGFLSFLSTHNFNIILHLVPTFGLIKQDLSEATTTSSSTSP